MRKKSLVPGRFQPFHDGHAALVQDVLDRGRKPVIAIRDTPLSEDDPFTVHERTVMIRNRFPNSRDVKIISIPNCDEIVHGRTPGWTVRHVDVPEDILAISGTQNRKGFRGDVQGRIVWITGQTGSGKSTLARALRRYLMPCVILDGDDLRGTISADLGYSLEDRLEQNRRVAELAKMMSRQVNVIVAVIAPTPSIRAKIGEIINPFWIYVSRESTIEYDDAPYQKPTSAEGIDYFSVNPECDPEFAAWNVYEWWIKLDKDGVD